MKPIRMSTRAKDLSLEIKPQKNKRKLLISLTMDDQNKTKIEMKGEKSGDLIGSNLDESTTSEYIKTMVNVVEPFKNQLYVYRKLIRGKDLRKYANVLLGIINTQMRKSFDELSSLQAADMFEVINTLNKVLWRANEGYYNEENFGLITINDVIINDILNEINKKSILPPLDVVKRADDHKSLAS